MRNIAKYCMILLLLAIANVLPAQNFSIEAQVDRDQVGFGESLNLVLTITQRLNAGGTQRISVPAISRIPGFDIASSRSAQSTRFINGEGETQSQMLYELVPQKEGKVTIPAFSFKDPDGNEHSTKPIEITVAAPEPEPVKEPARSESARPVAGSENSTFRWVLYLGLILGIIVGIPFVIYAIAGRSTGKASDNLEVAGNIARTSSSVKEEDAVVSAAVDNQIQNNRPSVNFNDSVATLKKQYPDVDGEFYRRYFNIFREAALSRSASLQANMTSDELLRRICELSAGEGILHASRRLAADMDMVLYANRAPARSFAAIDADAREVIRAIND